MTYLAATGMTLGGLYLVAAVHAEALSATERQRSLALSLLLTLLLTPLSAQPPPEKTVVVVKVVQARDGQPLVGASVLLYRQPDDAPGARERGRHEARTGANGVARFDEVEEGDYSVTVSLSGFESKNQKLALTPKGAELTFQLWPFSSLRGIVLGPDGKAVSSPRVLLWFCRSPGPRGEFVSTPQTSLRTKSNGAFHWQRAATGPGVVFAFAPGLGYGVSAPFDAKEGRPVEGIEVKLVPGQSIELLLLEKKTGEPIPGVAVGFNWMLVMGMASQQYLQSSNLEAVSDSQGKCRFSGLPPGTLSMTILAPGFSAGNQREFLLLPGQMQQQGTVELEKNPQVVTVAGQVMGPEAVANLEGRRLWYRFFPRVANAAITPSSWWQEFETRTEEKGGFHLYTVLEKPELIEDTVVLFRVEGVGCGVSEPIPIAPGKETQNIVVPLVPGVSLGGVVIDSRGQPMSGAQLQLNMNRYSGNFSPWIWINEQVSSEGAFELFDLPDGNYNLTARSEGYGDVSMSLSLKPGDREEGLRPVLYKPATVSGRLLEADGKTPIGSQTVRWGLLRDPRELLWMSRDLKTDAEGAFKQTTTEFGDRHLSVYAMGHGYAISRLVQLAEGATIEAGDIVLQPGGQITGGVYEGKKRTPLPDVEVSLHPVAPNSTGYSQSVKTDAEGRYRFAGLPTSLYRVALAQDQWMYHLDLPVAQRSTGQADFHVSDTEETQGASAPTVELTGVVLAAEGNTPLSGVKVKVYPYGAPQTETNVEGLFSLKGFSAGRDLLEFRAPGYPGMLRKINAGADQTQTHRLVLVKRSGSISGQVLDRNGKPMPKCRVRACLADRAPYPSDENYRLNDSEWNSRYELVEGLAVSDDQGRYKVDNLKAACYTVWAVGEGYGNACRDEVFLNAGKEDVDCDIRVQPLARLRFQGILLDPEGKPLPRKSCQTRAFPINLAPYGSFESDQVTDGAGRVERPLERPGRYDLLLSLGGKFQAYLSDFSATYEQLPPEQTVKMEPWRPGTLIVRVLLPDGRTPVPDVLVLPMASRQPRLYEDLKRRAWLGEGHVCLDHKRLTDSEGAATFNELLPGLYAVVAYPIGPWAGADTNALAVTLSDAVLLGAGERAELELILSRTSIARGRIVDEVTGKPVPHAGLRLVPVIPLGALNDAPLFNDIRADGMGDFTLWGLPEGVYHIGAAKPGYSTVTWQRVEVRAGKQLPDLLVRMRETPKATLTGRVLLTDGRPAEGAWVYASPIDVSLDRQDPLAGELRLQSATEYEPVWRNVGGAPFKDLCDDAGQFTLRGLNEGAYRVLAWAPGYAAAAEPVDLGKKNNKEMKLVLPRGADVRGRVLQQDGKTPAENVTVALTGPEGLNGPGWYRYAKTDTRGEFRFEFVPPGKGAVLLWDGECWQEERDFQVVEGSQLEDIELTLRPKGEVTGVVRDKNTGKPLPGATVTLFHRLLWTGSRIITTAPDGVYRFKGVPPGSFTLVAHAPSRGFQPSRGLSWTSAAQPLKVDMQL